MMANTNFHRDRIAQVYLGLVSDEETQSRATSRINWLANQVTGKEVLDVGCSEGILAIILGRKGIDVTGVDINPEAIAYAKDLLAKEELQTHRHVTFLCEDFENLDINLKQFDCVILGEIIEHLEYPQELIAKGFGLLKTGGILLVTTPFGHFPDPDHKTTFTPTKFLSHFMDEKYTPQHFSIEGGYIRFVIKKEPDTTNAWEFVGNTVLEITEKALLEEQIAFHFRLDAARKKNLQLAQEVEAVRKKNLSLTQEINITNEKNHKLLNESQSLLTKYRGLQARYHHLTHSIAYQMSVEIGETLKPISWRVLFIPAIILKFFIRWLAKKTILQKIKSKIQHIYAKFVNKNMEFDENAQEETFITALNSFISKTNAYPDKPVVIISSGTKRIGVVKRVNRNMAFAQELANMEIPVIYVYYRWKASDDFNSDYDGGYLLQFPNSLFHKLSPSIVSAFSARQKLFLISLPDINGVHELPLYALHNWTITYEVRDEWNEFYKAGVGKWYHPVFEKYLCANADFVTTVSTRLYEKMIDLGAQRQHIFIIPNGLKSEFLYKAQPIFNKRMSGYQGTGIIGYFGHLTEKWFDWDLLTKTASNHPELIFEIIGFDAPKSLSLPPNITLLGEKSHDEIIEIAQFWSLAIIPFKINELSRAVDPIKLYEYQAMGLPCVSCPMDQIKGYPFTFIYQTEEDFFQTIKQALEYRPTSSEWDTLHEFVKNNTWKQRVIKTLEISGIDYQQGDNKGKLL